MSALVRWGQQNPKKAGLLSIVGLIGGIKKLKGFLATPKSLKNKIIVITGGACGLGKLLALKCFNEGSIVIVWDINKNGINECNNIQSNNNNGQIHAKLVDVTNRAKVFEEANIILNKYAKIDILIQNAGVVAGRPFLELTEKDIKRTYNVNIISHYWTLQAFLPSMIENKNGHIVNIISTSALCPVSHLTDYGPTKSAARAFEMGIKRELQDLGLNEGIIFTGIYPHFMNTGMFEGAKNSNNPISFFWTGREMLDPEYVANETINAIKYEKREIMLPYRLGHWLYVAHNLPHKWQDDAAVMSNSMKEFIGGKNRLSKL